MRKVLSNLKKFGRNEDGAALAEYAVLLAIIIALGIGALTTFSTGITGVFTAMNSVLASAAAP